MAKPLTNSINALTTYANSVTGASDTTLSEAVATLANGYGQGGGVMQLIDTVTIDEDTRGFSFDVTKYATYDTVIAWEDITLSGSTWLYYVKNGTQPSGGTYNNGSYIHHIGVIYLKFPMGGTSELPNKPLSAVGFISIGGIGAHINNRADTNSIFIYAYAASTLIKAGSTIKVYGGNLNEQ